MVRARLRGRARAIHGAGLPTRFLA
jgi:hypothetical protein